jgi:hypothetical protein
MSVVAVLGNFLQTYRHSPSNKFSSNNVHFNIRVANTIAHSWYYATNISSTNIIFSANETYMKKEKCV